MLGKKAQESRNDMLAWYVACMVLMLLFAGGLYSFGIVGDQSSVGVTSSGGGVITAAAVVTQNDADVQRNITNSTEPNT